MDGGDAARRDAVGAALVERVARHRVVEAVAARGDLHAAADAEHLRPDEGVRERIGQRIESPGGGEREAALDDMHMAIDRAGDRPGGAEPRLHILGGLSTIFWALMIVVSLKYVVLIMRADNRGEGGIMALIALALSAIKGQPRWRVPLLGIGIFGASLFYGDAVLTPAISVLSAVEGLEVGTRAFRPYVVPIAVVVLVALFAFEASGTAAVGKLFGPVMLTWFIALALSGLHGIAQAPEVLAALNPVHALGFLSSHGAASFIVLGAVVLAVTGAEALYADMGHFGKAPVRLAWFGLVEIG